MRKKGRATETETDDGEENNGESLQDLRAYVRGKREMKIVRKLPELLHCSPTFRIVQWIMRGNDLTMGRPTTEHIQHLKMSIKHKTRKNLLAFEADVESREKKAENEIRIARQEERN